MEHESVTDETSADATAEAEHLAELVIEDDGESGEAVAIETDEESGAITRTPVAELLEEPWASAFGELRAGERDSWVGRFEAADQDGLEAMIRLDVTVSEDGRTILKRLIYYREPVEGDTFKVAIREAEGGGFERQVPGTDEWVAYNDGFEGEWAQAYDQMVESSGTSFKLRKPEDDTDGMLAYEQVRFEDGEAVFETILEPEVREFEDIEIDDGDNVVEPEALVPEGMGLVAYMESIPAIGMEPEVAPLIDAAAAAQETATRVVLEPEVAPAAIDEPAVTAFGETAEAVQAAPDEPIRAEPVAAVAPVPAPEPAFESPLPPFGFVEASTIGQVEAVTVGTVRPVTVGQAEPINMARAPEIAIPAATQAETPISRVDLSLDTIEVADLVTVAAKPVVTIASETALQNREATNSAESKLNTSSDAIDVLSDAPIPVPTLTPVPTPAPIAPVGPIGPIAPSIPDGSGGGLAAESSSPGMQLEVSRPVVQIEASSPAASIETSSPAAYVEAAAPTAITEVAAPVVLAETATPAVKLEAAAPFIASEPAIEAISAPTTVESINTAVPDTIAEAVPSDVQTKATMPKVRVESSAFIQEVSFSSEIAPDIADVSAAAEGSTPVPGVATQRIASFEAPRSEKTAPAPVEQAKSATISEPAAKQAQPVTQPAARTNLIGTVRSEASPLHVAEHVAPVIAERTVMAGPEVTAVTSKAIPLAAEGSRPTPESAIIYGHEAKPPAEAPAASIMMPGQTISLRRVTAASAAGTRAEAPATVQTAMSTQPVARPTRTVTEPFATGQYQPAGSAMGDDITIEVAADSKAKKRRRRRSSTKVATV